MQFISWPICSAVTKDDRFIFLAFSQFELPEDVHKDIHLGVDAHIKMIDAHIKMIDDNLTRYGILVTDLLFLLSDNTNCNKSLAKKVRIPFIS